MDHKSGNVYYTLISKNVVAVQSNKHQAKTEMNAGFMKVMFSNQTRYQQS